MADDNPAPAPPPEPEIPVKTVDPVAVQAAIDLMAEATARADEKPDSKRHDYVVERLNTVTELLHDIQKRIEAGEAVKPEDLNSDQAGAIAGAEVSKARLLLSWLDSVLAS